MTELELRQRPINWLAKYEGISEYSKQHQEILDTYNNSGRAGYRMQLSDPWCAAAASAAFVGAGLTDLFPIECSCDRMITKAKNMGIWVENDAYVPKTSDVILYDWDDNGVGDNTGSSDHVGLVARVDGNVIVCLEGNCSDTVKYRRIGVNARYIRGFITPKFAEATGGGSDDVVIEQPTQPTEPVQPVPASGHAMLRYGMYRNAEVKLMQGYLLKLGYDLGADGADGDFGAITYASVLQFQKDKDLEQDGIVGDYTWNALIKAVEALGDGGAATPEQPVKQKQEVKKGDLVSIADNARWYNGALIPGWVKNNRWFVLEVNGDRAVLDKSEDGKSRIVSPIKIDYLTVV